MPTYVRLIFGGLSDFIQNIQMPIYETNGIIPGEIQEHTKQIKRTNLGRENLSSFIELHAWLHFINTTEL